MTESPNEYECDSCSYVYKSSNHGGIDLDAQPSDFVCPTCQVTRDHFHLVIPASDDVVEVTHEVEQETNPDPLGPRLVYTKDGTPDISSLINRYKSVPSKLDPQPDFQRYEVWSLQKKSRLVESVLLDMPIPPLFFVQEDDSSSAVIDGQQRLMALFRFLEDEYALAGVSTKLEGLKFSQLDPKLQDRIRNSQLKVTEILKESDSDLRFELFRRLNEGSTSLNDQELRNCIYRGAYNEFLKRLANKPGWRKILGLKGTKPHARMVDVELVLRFMAFRDQTYLKHPDKRTSRFLDNQMRIGASYDEKTLKKAEADFDRTVELMLSVYGDRAGRRFTPGDDDNPSGKWDSRRNGALLDVQLWGFSRASSKGPFIKNSDRIREASIDLMCEPDFRDLITHTISEAKRVERRFDLWKAMVDSVIDGHELGPRIFPRKLKESLFAKDPSCERCGNKINDIDDAHVDHVVPYSKGGKTEESNAALLHRFCNQQKGASEAGDGVSGEAPSRT